MCASARLFFFNCYTIQYSIRIPPTRVPKVTRPRETYTDAHQNLTTGTCEPAGSALSSLRFRRPRDAWPESDSQSQDRRPVQLRTPDP